MSCEDHCLRKQLEESVVFQQLLQLDKFGTYIHDYLFTSGKVHSVPRMRAHSLPMRSQPRSFTVEV